MKEKFPHGMRILIAVALIFVALVVGGAVIAVKQARQNREALKELATLSDGFGNEMTGKIGKEDTVQGATAKAQRLQDEMTKAAAKLTGNDAISMRAAQRLMSSTKPVVASYEASYSGFMTKGGLEATSLPSEEAIGERIALLKRFETANHEFTDHLKRADEKYRAALIEEGFPASKMEEAAREFRNGANIETLLAIRAVDAELCAVMFKYLHLLDSEWGKWKVAEEGNVVFQNEDALKQFTGYAEQLQEMAQRQADLQKKILRPRQQGRGAAQGQ